MNKVYDKIFKYSLQMIVIIFCVFPFYYSVMTSLEGSSAVFEPNFFPTEINPKNYKQVQTISFEICVVANFFWPVSFEIVF